MRLIATLTAALFLCLTGCSGGPIKPPESPLAGRSGNYSAQASIQHRSLTATAVLSHETPESCIVRFTAPAALEGLSFSFLQDHVDVEYKGQSFQFDSQSVPSGAAAASAVSAISKVLRDDGVTVSHTGQSIALSGTLDVGEFTLTLDPEKNIPAKLSIPSQELTIEFQNFTFLD